MMYIFWGLIFIGISGCATKKPEGQTSAEILYKEALELFQDERYLIASEKLNTIKTQHPYSYFATSAELLLADIHYAQENFIEAASAYGLFKDLHPKHEKMEYVLWRQAESYFNQLPPTFDRDLSMANEAMRLYLELKEKYPNSSWIDSLQQRIDHLESQLKQKELYVADFYFRTKVYASAIYRYQQIIQKYMDNPTKELAQFRLIKSAYELQDKTQCLDYARDFIPHENKTVEAKLLQYKSLCEQLTNDTHESAN